jgi:glycolate oxidase
MPERVASKADLVQKLATIVGEDHVVTEKERLDDFLSDETSPIVRPKPSSDIVLVKPATTQDVSNILRTANRTRIPVFIRGGGTGLVGGAVPTQSGIVLSLERMDKIIEVDRENMMVIVEAGVTLGHLITKVERAGFFFPLHPGDEAAQIGGIVACNAGGARAVKYGVIRDYVKGMVVVLPSGDILNLGGKLLKNVAGYDLMHLLIGSEGTLGVIAGATLRVYPKSKKTLTLVIPYENRYDALRTVPHILQKGIVPLALEYVERELMEESAKKLGKTWPVKEGVAYLILSLTANRREELYLDAEQIDCIAKRDNCTDTLVVEKKQKQDDILSIRSNIYLTLKPYTLDILDLAVPLGNTIKLLEALDKIAQKYKMHLPVYGHAGDGNLHPQILMEEAGGVSKEALELVKREIYDVTIGLGGTITAEHGIGKTRISHLSRVLDQKTLSIMRGIKKILDPNEILNPGTILD